MHCGRPETCASLANDRTKGLHSNGTSECSQPSSGARCIGVEDCRPCPSEDGNGRILIPLAILATKVILERAGNGTQKPQVIPTTLACDETRVRNLLREILEDSGYEVMLAGDALEGLALFKSTEFDAVFSDIGMPGMSGSVRSEFQTESRVPLASDAIAKGKTLPAKTARLGEAFSLLLCSSELVTENVDRSRTSSQPACRPKVHTNPMKYVRL